MAKKKKKTAQELLESVDKNKSSQELIDDEERKVVGRERLVNNSHEKIVTKSSGGKDVESLRQEVQNLETKQLQKQEKMQLQKKIKAIKFKESAGGRLYDAGKTVFGSLGKAGGQVFGSIGKAMEQSKSSGGGQASSQPQFEPESQLSMEQRVMTPRKKLVLFTPSTSQPTIQAEPFDMDAKINEVANFGMQKRAMTSQKVTSKLHRKRSARRMPKKPPKQKSFDVNELLRRLPQ